MNSDKDIDIPWWQKLLALAAVAVIGVVVLLGINLLSNLGSGGSGGSAGRSYSCDTRFDPTACPEPTYDQTIEESKAYPDATPYDY